MDLKKVTATIYDVSRIDDIGESYYIECVCPYCGEEIKSSGMMGYSNDYDGFLYHGMVVNCPDCKKSCCATPQ